MNMTSARLRWSEEGFPRELTIEANLEIKFNPQKTVGSGRAGASERRRYKAPSNDGEFWETKGTR